MLRKKLPLKICGDCSQEKPLEDFHIGSKGKPRVCCKPCERTRNRNYRTKYRLEMINIMGGKCANCDFNDWRALQVDHVEGNGNQERKAQKHQREIYKKAVSGDPAYQLLCANCNWIKRYEEEEMMFRFQV